MIAAELSNLVNFGKKPKTDKQGNCVHPRAQYQHLGRYGIEVCPDCPGIKIGGEWSKPQPPRKS